MPSGSAESVALKATTSGELPEVGVAVSLATGGWLLDAEPEGMTNRVTLWAGTRVPGARSQATGLYNLAYYAGSSVLGWALGFVLARAGWGGVVAAVSAAVVLAGLVSAALLRDEDRPVTSAGSA